MPLRLLDHFSGLIHQATGKEDSPPVVYLPGVHGDWTPLARARSLLNAEVRLVEAAYPRLSHWKLEDFARALEELLDALELESAHLVGESFGSLVAWEFGVSRPERVRSLLLVGGFSQPPPFGGAAIARHALSLMPTVLLEAGVDLYVAHQNWRGQHRLPPAEGARPYAAVRTSRGRRATANRMQIIQRTDFRPHLPRVAFPVRYIGGEKDRLVSVRREVGTLESHLSPACDFQSRVLPAAPHMIIASHPEQTAAQIKSWVQETETDRARGASEIGNRIQVPFVSKQS